MLDASSKPVIISSSACASTASLCANLSRCSNASIISSCGGKSSVSETASANSSSGVRASNSGVSNADCTGSGAGGATGVSIIGVCRFDPSIICSTGSGAAVGAPNANVGLACCGARSN